MIDYRELKKANGFNFFEARRMDEHGYIAVNWIGLQSLETIVMGGNLVLSMLRERPCQGILNSNRELIGPWDVAVNWLVFRWSPQAKALGVKHYAHVLSPGIYGQRSYELFSNTVTGEFKLKSFEDEERAGEWLQRMAL
ncbi:hypothetical protein FVR03_20265 [Pontibacter qinzhouensis]|uniref:STAS/SEC14 domain-containing protein n=1 Tax=Pontibacter qinzhouensis TaxID=2603253 RepID=A0A5C8J3S5_9BACT|nr:hypothetical protein [Pontibacter qinzhouensis]TXK29857.1 hypothetical protein FVR03_20265 [Pontibacter qinzhouensis]